MGNIQSVRQNPEFAACEHVGGGHGDRKNDDDGNKVRQMCMSA